MKAIQINVVLQSDSGASYPAGCVVVPVESDFNRMSLNNDGTKMISTFVLKTYVSKANFELGKKDISSLISIFPQVLQTKTLVSDYEGTKAEALTIKEVKQELKKVFTGTGDLTEIDVIPKL